MLRCFANVHCLLHHNIISSSHSSLQGVESAQSLVKEKLFPRNYSVVFPTLQRLFLVIDPRIEGHRFTDDLLSYTISCVGRALDTSLSDYTIDRLFSLHLSFHLRYALLCMPVPRAYIFHWPVVHYRTKLLHPYVGTTIAMLTRACPNFPLILTQSHRLHWNKTYKFWILIPRPHCIRNVLLH
jgi:hypothetical protein